MLGSLCAAPEGTTRSEVDSLTQTPPCADGLPPSPAKPRCHASITHLLLSLVLLLCVCLLAYDSCYY